MDVAAELESGGGVWFASSGWRGGSSGLLVDGEVGLGAGDALLVRVMSPRSGVLRLNDAGSVVMRDFFGVGGPGRDLWVHVVAGGGEAVFPVGAPLSAGWNYVNLAVPEAHRGVLDGIGEGDRFVFALSSPATAPPPTTAAPTTTAAPIELAAPTTTTTAAPTTTTTAAPTTTTTAAPTTTTTAAPTTTTTAAPTTTTTPASDDNALDPDDGTGGVVPGSEYWSALSASLRGPAWVLSSIGDGVNASFGGLGMLADPDGIDYTYRIDLFDSVGADADSCEGAGMGAPVRVWEDFTAWMFTSTDAVIDAEGDIAAGCAPGAYSARASVHDGSGAQAAVSEPLRFEVFESYPAEGEERVVRSTGSLVRSKDGSLVLSNVPRQETMLPELTGLSMVNVHGVSTPMSPTFDTATKTYTFTAPQPSYDFSWGYKLSWTVSNLSTLGSALTGKDSGAYLLDRYTLKDFATTGKPLKRGFLRNKGHYWLGMPHRGTRWAWDAIPGGGYLAVKYTYTLRVLTGTQVPTKINNCKLPETGPIQPPTWRYGCRNFDGVTFTDYTIIVQGTVNQNSVDPYRSHYGS